MTVPFNLEPKQAKLQEWHEALQAAAAAKPLVEKEQALRKEVSAMFFPDPVEGVNTIELPSGWKLKLTHKIDRKIDETVLQAVLTELRSKGINFDTVVNMKPELATKTYKAMMISNKEAVKVFDTCLTIKPASPTMELVEPKEK
jgi:hypothetical protein